MQTQSIKTIEFERPQMGMGASCVAKAWARVPAELSQDERAVLKERIKRLLKEKQTVLVAHYYVDADLQDLAEETGGCVSDSLEIGRQALGCIDRMLAFAAQQKANVRPSGDLAQEQKLFAGIGPA